MNALGPNFNFVNPHCPSFLSSLHYLQSFLTDIPFPISLLFFTRPLLQKGSSLSVCPSLLFPSSNIQWFDGLDHANHIFSESSSCWQPVPPCSDPVPPSTNQYHPLLTQYSIIWWFRPCKPNIFWKHITLATSTAVFWSSITKHRPVPPYTSPVPPSNNQCRPLPTKYNQVPISTA